jgi:hypothetical protein
MQHLESGVVWGTVLLAAGVLVVLNALGLDIGLSPFFGILLLVAGALVLFRVLRLEMATRASRGRGGRTSSRPDGISPIGARVGHTLVHRWGCVGSRCSRT